MDAAWFKKLKLIMIFNEMKPFNSFYLVKHKSKVKIYY